VIRNRFWQLILACGLAGWVAGCATDGGGLSRVTSGGPSQPVEQLHLLLTSMAVDVDGRPGPDGFGVRLYASHRRAKEATPIESGTLELMMFDGRLAGGELEAATPLKTWRFAAQELKARAQKTEIGTSYRFILSWGAQRPTKGTITIVARYEPLRGRPVRSGPGTIPMSVP